MVGRKNYFLVILNIFLVFGCSATKNGLDDEDSHQVVQYFVFNRQKVNTVVVDTVEFSLIISKNNEYSVFEYNNDNRKEIYEINFFESKGFIVHSNDTVILHFLDKKEVVLFQTKDTTTIYKFISLNPGIDNASYYYFTPRLGLILKKSTTWPVFSELSKHYLDKKYTFNLLLSLVYNEKNFHNGIHSEFPPSTPIKY